MASTKQVDERNVVDGSRGGGFTADEKAAMRERARELKAASKKGGQVDGEADVQAAIAKLSDVDRRMAERIHALVKAAAPGLQPRTWYGMPAYARDGKVVCHFQAADKFKTRYATFGFSDEAALDDGSVWPVAFALHELDAAAESRITELVKRAVG